MVDCYVIRRKSDGKLYPLFNRKRTQPDEKNRQAPRVFKAFHVAASYYNKMGCGAAIEWEPWPEKEKFRWQDSPHGKPIKWDHSVRRNSNAYQYSELELVKFSSTGEVVVCAGEKCILKNKDVSKLQPINVSPLTSIERRAGIKDEIGLLLGDIENAEKAMSEGRPFDLEKLNAQIEIKKVRLQSALDELSSSYERLRTGIREEIKKSI